MRSVTARRLNALLAVEKDIKKNTQETITKLHHLLQKPALVSGLRRTYTPREETGEQLAPETQNIQLNAETALRQATAAFSELFDITAAKDMTNTGARADIVVGTTTLATQVPATTLLFLEKQLVDLQTFVAKLPELDPGESWQLDVNSNEYRAQPSQTIRTKKVTTPLILVQATDKHPAQCQMVTEDIPQGVWTSVKASAAIPAPRKQALALRVQTLLSAVKVARENANQQEVQELEIGSALMNYILA